METRRLLLFLALLILLSSPIQAITADVKIQKVSWLPFLNVAFDAWDEKIILHDNDRVRFLYSIDYEKPVHDTYVGYLIMSDAQYYDPQCQSYLSRIKGLSIVQESTSKFSSRGVVLSKFLDSPYFASICTVQGIQSTCFLYPNPTAGGKCGYTAYAQASNPPFTSSGREGEINIDITRLSESGKYYVVGGYCTKHSDSLFGLDDTVSCQTDAVWVMRKSPDYCGGTEDGFRPITLIYDPDQYCWVTRGRKLCVDSYCEDPCGLEGSGCRDEDCAKFDLNNYNTQILPIVQKFGYNKTAILCLPELYCNYASDCKGKVALASTPLSDQNAALVSQKMQNLQGFESGAHCEKANPQNEFIKELNSVLGGLRYGYCQAGAVRAQDCFDTLGDPSTARYVDANGALHTGKTWSVDSSGKCVISECEDYGGTCTILRDGKYEIGICQAKDLKAGACSTTGMLDYCVGQCSVKTPPKYGTCNTNVDCGVINGYIGKCVKDASGIGTCMQSEIASPQELNQICTDAEWCYQHFGSALGRCQTMKCSSDGQCIIEETTCTSNLDCNAGVYTGRVCVDGCCESAFRQNDATCTDKIQNQGEQGIDCGGPCPACVPVVPPVDLCEGKYFSDPACFYSKYALAVQIIIGALFMAILVGLAIIANQRGWIKLW